MSRASVFDYFTTKTIFSDTALTSLAHFLIQQRTAVLSAPQSKAYFSVRALITTPLTHLATQAIDLGKDNLFSLMNVSTQQVNIPEVYTFRYVPFDLKQMPLKQASAFQAMAEYRDKIVFNMTPFLKSSGQFSDLAGFQNILVRDLLSRSFFTSETQTWLTPKIALFIAKIYSMSLATSVAEWFQLDIRTRGIIATFFAFYILEQMSDAETAQVYLKQQRKYLFLPETEDLDQIFGLIQDQKGVISLPVLDDVFTLINGLGIPRVDVSRRVLVTRLQKLGPDLYTTALALEYPPYFAYILLLSLSGAKLGISFRLKAMNLVKECKEFIDDIKRCVTFIPTLT